jgi:HTH-type transcriptional regulator/antitoxin HipB
MIQNERQYQVTRRKLAKLSETLEALQKQPDLSLPEIVRESDVFSIRYLMGELQTEIAEYDKLHSGEFSSLHLDSVLDELPSALTRARVARGWTQRDLAQALGSTEQQVKRDEQGGYAKASLARLSQVARTLGVSITGEVRLADP